MQATLGQTNIFFKRVGDRDYMMRSEKRQGYRSAPPENKKPRRPRTSWKYALWTLFFLLILYPVGLVMLWLKKIRWGGPLKLAVSLIMGVAYFVLMAFLLTVEVDNAWYTGAQNRVKASMTDLGEYSQRLVTESENLREDFPKNARAILYYSIENSQKALMRSVDEGYQNLHAVADNAAPLLLKYTDETMAFARDALYKLDVVKSVEPLPSPVPTVGPTLAATPTVTPTPTPTPAPLLVYYAPGDTRYHAQADCEAIEGAAESIPLTQAIVQGMSPCTKCVTEEFLVALQTEVALGGETETPEPTEVSKITATPSDKPTLQPTLIPTEKPTATATRSPLPESTEIPMERPVVVRTATVPPEAEPTEVSLENAKQTEVLTVTEAPTLAPVATEALQTTEAATPQPTLAPIATEAPTPNATLAPVATEAPAPTPADSVPKATPVPTLEAPPPLTPTPEPTPVPTPTPIPTPTPEPTPTPVPTPTPSPTPTPRPLPSVKPIGEATVLHTSNGKYYHLVQGCSGMSGARPYTLAESVAAGLKRCRRCDSPDPSLLDAPIAVWCGEDMLYHITDECANMTEKWVARTVEQAQAEGYTGCPLCEADRFGNDGKEKQEPQPTPVAAMPTMPEDTTQW